MRGRNIPPPHSCEVKQMLKPNLHRFFKYTCGGKYSQKDIDRFISHINITSNLGSSGNCWEWIGSYFKNRYGYLEYGQFSCCKNGKANNNRTNRVAIEMATNKIIPNGQCVLHKCDNPRCVNVLVCLFLGTHQENMNDKVNKKRQAFGEICNKKLTWNQVKEIRRLYNTGKYTLKQLGKIFFVSYAEISYIIRNKHWVDKDYILIKFKNTRRTKIE
jgi:hypothetical protein